MSHTVIKADLSAVGKFIQETFPAAEGPGNNALAVLAIAIADFSPLIGVYAGQSLASHHTNSLATAAGFLRRLHPAYEDAELYAQTLRQAVHLAREAMNKAARAADELMAAEAPGRPN